MPHSFADQDLYALLDVPPAATAKEIRVAFRRRAMQWHPDRNRHAGAEDAFKRIRAAYEVLCDPERRADYDRSVARQGKRAAAAAAEPAASAPRERRTSRAPDARRRVCITLDEQLRGRRVDLKVTRTEYCPACGGAGVGVTPVACGTCAGSGRIRPPLGLFSFFMAAPAPCPDCGGQGTMRPECAPCRGKGTQARKEGQLRFEIPAGMPPGGTLRVRGHGRRGAGGKAAGDLLINVDLAAHPLFEPDFPHLRCAMPVSVFRALSGGSIDVPTLEGAVSIPLPADPVDGAELRVRGHGMLDGVTGKRGDLVVRLRVIRPRTLTVMQRELLGKLDRLAAEEPAHRDWERRVRDAAAARPVKDAEAA
jgi:molecular chaperone DnaJ